jgi:sulfate adenylyltransferase subunit 2
MKDPLDALEAHSIYVLREAVATVSPLAMLWSIGKDSNVMLWLARKAFFGRVPFPVVHLDTDMEFDEVYKFRAELAKDWGFDFQIARCPPFESTDPSLPINARSAARKTEGLAQLIRDGQYAGVIAGIRRDEQATRAKERVFSPRGPDGNWEVREQPAELWDQFTPPPLGGHVRIHPLLAWTELDIWQYTKREGLPIVPLYFAKDGKRFRSLGEKNITDPVASTASTIDEIITELAETKTSERAGRTMDHDSEDAFERLRQGGYL